MTILGWITLRGIPEWRCYLLQQQQQQQQQQQRQQQPTSTRFWVTIADRIKLHAPASLQSWVAKPTGCRCASACPLVTAAADAEVARRCGFLLTMIPAAAASIWPLALRPARLPSPRLLHGVNAASRAATHPQSLYSIKCQSSDLSWLTQRTSRATGSCRFA